MVEHAIGFWLIKQTLTRDHLDSPPVSLSRESQSVVIRHPESQACKHTILLKCITADVRPQHARYFMDFEHHPPWCGSQTNFVVWNFQPIATL